MAWKVRRLGYSLADVLPVTQYEITYVLGFDGHGDDVRVRSFLPTNDARQTITEERDLSSGVHLTQVMDGANRVATWTGAEVPDGSQNPARLQGAPTPRRVLHPGRPGRAGRLPPLGRPVPAPREGHPGRLARDRGDAPADRGRRGNGPGATPADLRRHPEPEGAAVQGDDRRAHRAAARRGELQRQEPALRGASARLRDPCAARRRAHHGARQQADLAPVGRGVRRRPLGPVLPDQRPLRAAARALPDALLRRRDPLPAHQRHQLLLPVRDAQRPRAVAEGQGLLHVLRRLGALRPAQAPLHAAAHHPDAPDRRARGRALPQRRGDAHLRHVPPCAARRGGGPDRRGVGSGRSRHRRRRGRARALGDPAARAPPLPDAGDPAGGRGLHSPLDDDGRGAPGGGSRSRG